MAAPQSSVAAFTGKGGKVEITVDGATYVQVKGIAKVNSPSESMGMTDVTPVEGTSRRRSKLPTLIDDSVWSIDIIANQADPGQLLLAASFKTATLIGSRITYPPMPQATQQLVRTFNAYISKNGMAGLDVADASKYTSELTTDGDITDTMVDVSQ